MKWRGDGGLTTRQVCEAVRVHLRTGEKVFFNQVQLFHVACMESEVRNTLSSLMREEDFPRNAFYGDGSVIEDEEIRHISEVYAQTAVSFPWQEGDILMLDNMMVAHSRNPYVGPRKIVVAMGDMMSISEQPSDALGEGELALDYAS